MSVRMNIPMFLQHVTDGVKVAEVNGATVGECLQDFVRQFPDMKYELFDEDGNLHDDLTIWINRESTSPYIVDEPVEDGAELDILRLFTGG